MIANHLRRMKALGNNEAIDFDSQWAVLSSSLREIHTKNASKLSFEELYRNAYKLVLKKKGETLYNCVKDFEESWLANEIRPRILKVLSTSLLVGSIGATAITTVNEKRVAGEKLLKALKQAWEDHNLCMNMTTDVLMYMDRVYCTDNRKPSIFNASMGQFRDCVLRTPIPSHDDMTIAMVLYSVILDQVQMDREGDVIDKALIRSCIYMLEGLYESEDEEEITKLYLTSFEPEFLAASEDFYKSEGSALIRDADAGTFCRHARKRATEEQDRCRSTLSPLTAPKIKLVIENELIKNNIRSVIELEGSGVKFMLDNDRLAELEMIYDLISRVDPKKEELRKALQKRVVELGTDVNNAASNNIQAQSVKGTKPDAEKPEGEGKAVAEKPVNQQTAAAIKWVGEVLLLKEKFDT
ncbi:Cullin-3, partial [Toensbergia leucococca]|nr:Cullin-3 [Toensbergia leucococca]